MGTQDQAARWPRILLLLLGLVLPQTLLYAPSLAGRKVLLPLDIFAQGVYLPMPANVAAQFPDNFILSDEVLLGTPSAEYAAKQVRAGRIPLWNPQNFAGVPFASFPKYSPFFLIFCCWPSPITLAYLHLMKSVIAGMGAYLFFRRALGAGFWASAVGAWCYPLTGFFVQWQGYGLTQVVAWLPWVLLAVNLAIREPKRYGAVLLTTFTALTVLTGQLDVAGLVLLTSGLYAVACLVEVHGWRTWSRPAFTAVARLALGWGLGLLIATAYVVPLVEYWRTGERFARRAGGEEERPPVGIKALPQIVLPNVYGATKKGSVRIVEGNQLESSAAGYAGLLATLLVAPLAFSNPELRPRSFWWLGLLVLSLGWVLDIPGLVHLMRLPVLNMFSWNRWMLLTGFALTVLAVTGLDVLMQGRVGRRPWFVIPALLAAGVCAWCLYRMGHMPPALVNFAQKAYQAPANATLWGIPARQAVAMVESYFRFYYGVGAAFGATAVAAWAVLSWGPPSRGWMSAAAGSLMIAELLIYAYNVNPQCDPALYYPPLPAFAELKQRPPGRTLCISCLPPDLNLMVGLPDIRGYDAVDPKRLLDVLEFARAPRTSSPVYARTQWFIPWGALTHDGGLRVSPVLDMLNVRYLIWTGDALNRARTIIRHDGYVVAENEHALPRAFVPQTIQMAKDEQELMDQLRQATFDAARISYVTEPVQLPGECRGTARIVGESPERVVLDARMDTAGMVVLADSWYQGWRANVDAQVTPILVVNHAIRGVVVPAGEHRVVFQYAPASIRLGWIISGAAIVGELGWLGCIIMWRRKECRITPPVETCYENDRD
ncbi:MAG TPA: hypothetical protein VEK33_00475 [Terriglobales bacterium]|nr:hypothetical protein [Terriglobales bacterium]